MDNVDPTKRSWIMARVKSTGNTSTEMALVHGFRREGITGWRRNFSLFGKPDFVFPHAHIAVFVDGCFWHGHPTRCRIPATHREYWKAKIARNQARDRRVNRILRQRGWKVIRIWEHMVKQPRTIARIRRALIANAK